MKKYFSLMIICSLFLFDATAQPTDYIGYWPFNGNAADASTNGHNGLVEGATLTTDRFGNLNSAFSFNGTSDYISIPLGSNLNAPFSVSTWAYFNLLSPSGSDFDYVVYIGNSQNATNPSGMSISRNGNDKKFYCYSYNIVNYGPVLNGQQWVHLTAVFNTTAPYLRLYINGTEVSITDLPMALQTNGDLTIGKYKTTNGNFLNGKADEIMVFNRAISGTEVQQIYNIGSTVSGWQSDAGKTFMTKGSASIGTVEDAAGYSLAVDGKIIMEGVKVQNSSSWPDYVFHENYLLSDLCDLENEINSRGHLPGIPSEKEVAENGIALGEMSAKLLQKVEELTLYVIEVNKKIEQLEEENKVFKKNIVNKTATK
jgi:hypothetical protein